MPNLLDVVFIDAATGSHLHTWEGHDGILNDEEFLLEVVQDFLPGEHGVIKVEGIDPHGILKHCDYINY